jgi:hypothetical protein
MITPDGMVSWDRGFDEDNRQVWGSAVGGSVFDRIVDDVDSASELASESESEQTAEASETAPEEDAPPE